MFAWLRSLFTDPVKPALEIPPPEAFSEPLPSERLPETRPVKQQPWIGVDLDGTLAEATRWLSMSQIGPPVPLMMRRVKAWLDKGAKIKIVTARAGNEEGLAATKLWLKTHGLPDLEITDRKDFDMIELWDDRAIQVVHNTGICFLGASYFARPKAPILIDEIQNKTYVFVGEEIEPKPDNPPPTHS